MTRIHCLNNISSKGTDLLPDSYELVDELASADGVLVRSASLHDAEFPQSLVAIARAGAGVNNIPLERCAEEGIVVFNTPGANANAVKELVLCGMLLASRDVIGGIEWCKDNAADPDIAKTAEKAKKAFAGREVIGKKLGVIGLGAIGALVANAGLDLGMDVYGYDPYVSVGSAWRLSSDVRHVVNLDEICSECDYITIHVPAMDSTNGMIGTHEIGLMKSDAVFLNFSRDTLVDSEAIVEALNADKLGCYVTDFAIPTIMGAKNAIILPHLGASTAEAEENCAIMAVHQMIDYIENGNITNSVNYPACDMGACPTTGCRIAVLHRNIPGMITGITDAISAAGVNLANITSKARGNFAYTLIDLDADLTDEVLGKIQGVDGVVRLRVI
ncbi:MAG: 3-phosphoglycerate dehydrogenase [Eggerthellaceae bacterium]|nr:3-phosphoglycerate dehydrogenase [Eggerthellaceae bacterium]